MSALERIGLPPQAIECDGSGAHPLRIGLLPAPGARGWLARVADSLALNFSDVRRFGFAFLLRHFARFSAEPIYRVRAGRYGAFHVRKHESDLSVLREVFGEDAYDLSGHPMLLNRLQRRYRAILAAGRKPVVVDAGANIGAATAALGEAWQRATVVAIEPDPGNAALLRRNLVGMPNLIFLEAALGSVSGFAALTHPGLAWAVQTERAQAGVPILSMGQVLTAAGVDDGEAQPFICKIDIEGFEDDLFARDTGWIDLFDMIVIEPHDWLLPGRGTSRNLQRAMARRNFEMILHGHNIFYVRA